MRLRFTMWLTVGLTLLAGSAAAAFAPAGVGPGIQVVGSGVTVAHVNGVGPGIQ